MSSISPTNKSGATNQNADALCTSREPIALVALRPPMEKPKLAEAQKQDPVLGIVIDHLENDTTPPATTQWRKIALKHYQQIWSQLVLHDGILCRKVKSPTMTKSNLLIVVPKLKQLEFLKNAHEESRHQGMDRTMARVSETAYWVGMGRDVTHHCRYCTRCQVTKPPESKSAGPPATRDC